MPTSKRLPVAEAVKRPEKKAYFYEPTQSVQYVRLAPAFDGFLLNAFTQEFLQNFMQNTRYHMYNHSCNLNVIDDINYY